MKLVQELPSTARRPRQTIVQGADEKHYTIVTLRLYDFPVAPEFCTHETNVAESDSTGGRHALVQPIIKRFYSEADALGFHQEVLDRFDDMLHLAPPMKKEH